MSETAITARKTFRAMQEWMASPLGERFRAASVAAAAAMRDLGMTERAGQLEMLGVSTNPAGALLMVVVDAGRELETARHQIIDTRVIVQNVRRDGNGLLWKSLGSIADDFAKAITMLGMLRDVIADAATVTLDTALRTAEDADADTSAQRRL